MLNFDFIVNNIKKIEDSIEPHPSVAFVKNEQAIRLCYRSIGSTINRYINKTREEAPGFLLKHGIIDFIKNGDEETFMYRFEVMTKTFETDKQKVPFQYEKEVPVKWAQLHLPPTVVLTIAAREEYEATARIAGLEFWVDYRRKNPGKLVKLKPQFFRAAS